MHKSLDCAMEIMTKLADTEGTIGETVSLNFDAEYIRPAFQKVGLIFYEDDSERLLDRLQDDLYENNLTTCSIFEMAHTIHHHILAGAKRTAN